MTTEKNAFARFFDEMPLSREQVVGYRVVFFATVAVDAFLRMAYATRPGLCGFNAAHFPILDRILPTPNHVFMHLLQLAQVHLALLCAVGAATRRTMVLLTALYGVSYFISVSDSYAHHYLAFLLLGIWSFTDVEDPTRVRWPFRLALVQYAIVYFWAALGKVTPTWVTGEMMFDQPLPEWLRLGIFHFSQWAHVDILKVWSFVAQSVVITELALGFAICFNVGRPLLFLAGMGLHGFILLLNLRIGQFSWFMFCGYALVLPDAWRAWLWKQLRRVPWPAVAWDHQVPFPVVAGLGTVAALMLLHVPLDGMGIAVGIWMALLFAGSAGWPTVRRLFTHVASAVLVLFLAAQSLVVRNALEALGLALVSCGRASEGTAYLDRLVEAYPDYVDGLVYAADAHATQNGPDEARALYERALALEPDNVTARAHLDALEGR